MQQPCVVDVVGVISIAIPILQMGKLRQREIQESW